MTQNVEVQIASGDPIDVRSFVVEERLSALFAISVTAMSPNQSIDFEQVVGRPARFVLNAGRVSRTWVGICDRARQIAVEEAGLATYELSLVPHLWLASQRRNYRMFQQMSEIDIALAILEEWQIEPDVQLDRAAYKKRKYRVQYGESDFAFVSRMLEDAGVTYWFAQKGEETELVLSAAPQKNEAIGEPLPFVDNPALSPERTDFVTKVFVGQAVRPGKYTVRDHDYRRSPRNQPLAVAQAASEVEQQLERYHYVPGAMLYGGARGDDTPAADDRGKTRTDEREGAALAQRRLDAKRARAKVVTFTTNAYDVAPAVVLSITNHPRADLGADDRLLVLSTRIEGRHDGDWSLRAEANSAELAFRPPLSTPKPKAAGVESATVVGPEGEEIHVDEFGRVRVHFHWDRESQMDEKSSCWIHVSEPWGGAGYGGSNLPRVGQEVLVDFVGGDPDRPIITGRVYTSLQTTPYQLPGNKTQSGWKSNSTNGTGGYNEIMFEDASGRELVRMQAERDRQTLVKRNCSTDVRASRSTNVGAHESKTVAQTQQNQIGSDQSTGVGGSRTIQVVGTQTTTVGGNITQQSVEGSILMTAKRAMVSTAKRSLVQSQELTVIQVGFSSIVMRPDVIVIQSPTVLINPGSGVMSTIAQGGAIPPSQSEIDAGRRAEEQARATERYVATEQQHQAFINAHPGIG